MSPDPDKCEIIKRWPQPKSIVKSKAFSKQLNSMQSFLLANIVTTHPKLTKPLYDLMKKNVRFHWGQEQEEAFKQIKDRLCSGDVLVLYNTSLENKTIADSSPVGTQATVAQKHHINNEHA